MKKILIVEDSDLIQYKLSELLSSLECEIFQAYNGKEGLKLFKSENPDIVTLDITMPVMNGREALTRIMEINPDAVVIMLTALGQRSMIMDCLKLGAKDYLMKPLNEEKVISTIKKYL